MVEEKLPTKRVIVAGCRDYHDYEEAKHYLDFCLSDIKCENNIIIVSGCATGADFIGERYAEENGFDVERFPADWDKYGLSAGPRRNKQMAEICDMVICFWDGESKGTKSMISYAKKFNRPLKIKMI